jgi:hypothetical protein
MAYYAKSLLKGYSDKPQLKEAQKWTTKSAELSDSILMFLYGIQL